jgi:hypothetical protein
MDHWILWPVFVLLNGSAAAISLVSGTVVALSHTELEDLRRRDAQAAVSLERSRGDQGNTLAAFEVLIAAFVGMSALLGGILVGGRFLPDALAGGGAARSRRPRDRGRLVLHGVAHGHAAP